MAIAGLACSSVHEPALAPGRARPPPGLADELRGSVEALATGIGERNCYRPAALESAARWIERELAAAGFAVRRLPVGVPAGPPFECGPTTLWNIEAEKRGTQRPDEILVVGAHYDTKVATESWLGFGPPLPDEPGTPGADDNASGVAALLAIARALASTPTPRTIRFVAFVNEERPFYLTDAMGSLVYARALRAAGHESVVGMMSLEMLGCYSEQPRSKRFWFRAASLFGLPDRPDYVAFLSNRSSRAFARAAAAIHRRHSTVAVRTLALPMIGKLVAWSDDWAFWREGFPAFAATDTAFLRHDRYHEPTDTAEKLDYPEMAEVVWGLVHVVEALAGRSGP